ncbi:MAG: hypothetical protein IJC68_04110 [Firmicutes bacterium]|nr:hypothetical protein [Bacillota bacterium]
MEYGRLRAEVTTAGGLVPVEGAWVIVRTREEPPQLLSYQTTGPDGRTEEIRIATPDGSESRHPGPGPAFTAVDMIITYPGFFTVYVDGVQVFPGRTSIQYTVLQPLAGSGGVGTESITYIIPPQNL